MNGYLHPDYAKSFVEFGKPICLPRCKGWILKREIPDFPYYDAMGCYPLFSCENWSELFYDLENNMDDSIVSLALVTDPFGKFEENYLKRCFKDICVPFKQHFVINLKNSLKSIVSKHHRKRSRKALRDVKVEKCSNPIELLDEWESLYSTLVERQNIKGIRAFSRYAFQKQLEVPGIIAFKGLYNGEIVGIQLWYNHGKIAYAHLSAYSKIGYNLSASYAIRWDSIEYFMERNLSWLDIGAEAGLENRNNDGLTKFKEGWSTNRKTAYFCGRIFNKSKYYEIVKAKNVSETNYFPAYRLGEFG